MTKQDELLEQAAELKTYAFVAGAAAVFLGVAYVVALTKNPFGIDAAILFVLAFATIFLSGRRMRASAELKLQASKLAAKETTDAAAYVQAVHPDIMQFLDTKRESADEKIRIKTLSMGIVVPDVLFTDEELADDDYLAALKDLEAAFSKKDPLTDKEKK